MKLSKTQQICYDLLEYDHWKEAFLAVCEKNRNWKDALGRQFMTDANVCGVDDKYLGSIRQIRNQSIIVDFLDEFVERDEFKELLIERVGEKQATEILSGKRHNSEEPLKQSKIQTYHRNHR